MTPRITISTSSQGTLEIAVNPSGRDKLVALLQSLSNQNEHFHLAPAEIGMDCDLSEVPYNSQDQIVTFAKVLYRSDEWDEEHFPHVL